MNHEDVWYESEASHDDNDGVLSGVCFYRLVKNKQVDRQKQQNPTASHLIKAMIHKVNRWRGVWRREGGCSLRL